MTSPRQHLAALLAARLDERQRTWLRAREVALAAASGAAPSTAALAESLALASRFTPRSKLAPTADERGAAAALVPGWNPERWTLREALRVALVLAFSEGAGAFSEGAGDTLPAALEECFRFADEGELCALYRALQLLPDGARFAWRAGEGCRTNMGTVFQAVACDTGFPARHFDDIAWRQMCVKAIFTGAPLWRVYGLDTHVPALGVPARPGRVDSELTRMVLDGAEERRSAGRSVSPELWLCVGTFEPERARRAIAAEIAAGPGPGRTAAILALGRIGAREELTRLASGGDADCAATARRALAGDHAQGAWQALREDEI